MLKECHRSLQVLQLSLVKKSFVCCTVRTVEMFDRLKEGLEAKHLRTTTYNLEQMNIWYYLKYADIVLLEVALG